MNASEIAETLLNGNVAQARQHILSDANGDWPDAYDAAALALDVVVELAAMAPDYPDYQWALHKVRRCLEGAA